MDLDRSEFDGDGKVLEALAWLRAYSELAGDLREVRRTARRILRVAISSLPDAAVAASIAGVLLALAAKHAELPLTSRRGLSEEETDQPFSWTRAQRQSLIDVLTDVGSGTDVWWVIHRTPGILDPTDFPWLLRRSTIAACQQFAAPPTRTLHGCSPGRNPVRTSMRGSQSGPSSPSPRSSLVLYLWNWTARRRTRRGVCTGRCPPGQAGPDGVE